MIEDLLKLKEKNITPNQYSYLLIIKDGSNYLFNNWLSNEAVWLITNGYLSPCGKKLTKKGEDLLKKEDKVVENYENLYNSLRNKLFSLRGKYQIIGFGNVYFIPTKKELQEFLGRFFKNYPECKDLVKIEKILLSHIENCCKDNKFAPAVKYYIYKQGSGSQLANAYENFEEEKVNSFDGINI